MSRPQSATVTQLFITLVLCLVYINGAAVALRGLAQTLGRLQGAGAPGRTVTPSTALTTSSADERQPGRPQFVLLPADGSRLASQLIQTTTVPTVNVRAASEGTISFKKENGQPMGDAPAPASELPHLVLYRDGALTAPKERKVIVEVSGIQVPSTGVTVTLELETQHWDPDVRGGVDAFQGISVWRESLWVSKTSGVTETGGVAVFTHTFTATVNSGAETIATPTDYFRYDIAVIDAEHPFNNPLNAFRADHAFLMENQSTVRLPKVLEASDGAAPTELIVYYCDMFPFQNSIRDPTTWLLREEVPAYVQEELLPQMIDAFRRQTDDWVFPWYDAWTSMRPGEETNRLSIALSDGSTWYHGRAPYKGDSKISLKATGGNLFSYDTLTDALMSTFHHELFHNLQRNIQRKFGGHGRVSGELDSWAFITEGTAVLASSVAQPRLQFAPGASGREYMFHANHFLKNGGPNADLDTSNENLFPYRAALYWRFLYEQCGGMHSQTRDGVEDPTSGMQVIRRTLTVLFSGDVVDITSSAALVENLPELMDRALEGSHCPFETHTESLIAFARSIYALRLDGGRCTEQGSPASCGFYDPHNLYHDPTIDTITYAGADLEHRDGIRSSFGMDFVDVKLDPAADGQPLTLQVRGAPGANAAFNVEIWKLMDSGGETKPRRVTGPSSGAEMVTRTNFDGQLIYEIPAIDVRAYNRLGLIITRIDAQESVDPFGEYTIVLKP